MQRDLFSEVVEGFEALASQRRADDMTPRHEASPNLQVFADRVLRDGRVVVVNHASRDIPLNTVFTRLSTVRRPLGNGPQTLIRADAIQLTITEIHFFRHMIDALPKGHNAALRLAGVGLDCLLAHLQDKPVGAFVFLDT
ncbi:hypothetical protein [Parachitinimonas caeni]|uniref:Uncharacterized protein n=1 Tax=Parachitinimonas caeni TaxID=3031301 RepID=A0ABT7E3U5_9NEIS|nr:hypothetical protein [Parachitinimonas caeni]MDK2126980.1 hypothetical protein [Parachitinimonas caeni]